MLKKIQRKTWNLFFWLLSVDENGCLEGEECDELVQIDGEYGGFSTTLDPHNLWTEVDFTNSEPESYRYYLPFGAQLVQTFDRGLTYLTEIYQSNTMNEENWSPTSSYLKTGTFFDQSLQEYFWRPDEIWLVDELRHKLLYDFALEVGDNFESDLLPDGVHLDVISKRSIMMEDDSPRDVLKLRCSNDPNGDIFGERTWIQGVGDTKGLLSIKDCCRNEKQTQLLCYSTSGVLRYEFQDSKDCWTLNTTSVEFSPERIKMHLSPNPASNFVTLTFEENILDYEVKLFNSLGQVIKKYQYQNNQSIKINISNIPNGIYFIHMNTNEGIVFSEKLLIEK